MGVHVPRQQAVQIGLQVAQETPVVATLELPLVGDMVTPTMMAGVAEVKANWSFPSVTRVVGTGTTHRIRLAVEANVNSLRDLILLSTKDASGDLPHFTLVHKQGSNGLARYSWCQTSELALTMARSGTPGEDILLAILTVECGSMTEGQPGSYASLTAPSGRNFQTRHSTITINSTAVPMMLNTSVTVRNNNSGGPVNPTSERLWLIRGDESLEISIQRAAVSLALKNLVAAQTESVANSIVFATGVENETVTMTMGKLLLGERGQGEAEGVVSETVPLHPYHTGSAHQATWSFGSSIGASALGL